MTDEIRLSWEKKISVREIAQFYEERIRELDGKFQLLAEQSRQKIIRAHVESFHPEFAEQEMIK